jgi:hypothetical protein
VTVSSAGWDGHTVSAPDAAAGALRTNDAEEAAPTTAWDKEQGLERKGGKEQGLERKGGKEQGLERKGEGARGPSLLHLPLYTILPTLFFPPLQQML